MRANLIAGPCLNGGRGHGGVTTFFGRLEVHGSTIDADELVSVARKFSWFSGSRPDLVSCALSSIARHFCKGGSHVRGTPQA